MKVYKKILIGGTALKQLGSNRYTDDVDYMIWLDDDYTSFHHDKENNIDYLNANSTNFFESVWNAEKGNEIASPQSLFDLKAFSLLSHFRNGNIKKANDAIFDLRFLHNEYKIEGIKLLKGHITQAEEKFINENLKINEN